MSPNAHQRRGLLSRALHRIWTASVPDFSETLIVDGRTGQPEKADERYAASATQSGYSLAWWLCMVIIAVVAFGSLLAPASAQTIGVHLGSWHSEPGYNNANPGLYVRSAAGWTAGAYRNSVRRTSTYAGISLHTDEARPLSLGLTLGGVTGYPAGTLLPLVVPSVRWGLTDQAAVRLAVLPKVHPKQGAHVLHLSAEWTLP